MSTHARLAAAILAGGASQRFGGADTCSLAVGGTPMPFLSKRFLAHFAAISGADAVIPRDGTGWQPLCAIYGRACAASIRERLGRGERHAAVPLAGVRVVEIGPGELAPYDPEGLLFVNVNTPHDYAQARRLLEKAGRPMLPRISDRS